MPLVFDGYSVSFYEAMEAAGATIQSYGEFQNYDETGGWYVCATFHGQLLFLCWTDPADSWEGHWSQTAHANEGREIPTQEEIVAFGMGLIRNAVPYERLGPMLRHAFLRSLDRVQVFGWLRTLSILQAYRARQAARKTLASLSPKYPRS